MRQSANAVITFNGSYDSPSTFLFVSRIQVFSYKFNYVRKCTDVVQWLRRTLNIDVHYMMPCTLWKYLIHNQWNNQKKNNSVLPYSVCEKCKYIHTYGAKKAIRFYKYVRKTPPGSFFIYFSLLITEQSVQYIQYRYTNRRRYINALCCADFNTKEAISFPSAVNSKYTLNIFF